jgi:glycosyltransferase involved in cell wall biosynthesis
MVQHMLDGLREDERLDIYHINARVSGGVEDIGSFRPSKLLRLLTHCAKALSMRARHGRMALYYVPAPAKRSAMLRDWIVMSVCRPFFPELILHWHAYGLGTWATTGSDWPRRLTRCALGKATLSIVLSEHNVADAARFNPSDIVVVPNGIPDPCPDFDANVLPSRQDVDAGPCRCLFLAHCTRSKGLFEALDAVALVNSRKLLPNRTVMLTVAGQFVDENERRAFEKRIQSRDLQDTKGSPIVRYVGFLDAKAKDRVFRSHDCIVVPSHWESFGLTVVEAAAYGLPAVTSDHPNLVGLLPAGLSFSGRTDPEDLSMAIVDAAGFRRFADLRKEFVDRYPSQCFIRNISQALLGVEK